MVKKAKGILNILNALNKLKELFKANRDCMTMIVEINFQILLKARNYRN